MNAAFWTATILLGALSLLVIVANPVAATLAVRRGRNYSAIPLIGGLSGCLALLCCPVATVRWFAWLPLILDYSIPAFVYLAFKLFRNGFRH